MQLRITVPLASSLLALAVHQARAQTANADDVYVMVTTAIHQHSAATALPVTQLSGDLLHENARATLGDTLAMQPGISNASFGPAVGQTVIRGQQGRRVMNLTNGIPNEDASGNSSDHAQTAEPLLASSIEVLRGPSTLLYGGGAIGGVVNVIDKRIASVVPDKPDFAVELRHDTASNLQNTVVGTNFATNALVWHLDAVQREWDDQSIPALAVDPNWLNQAKLMHPTLDASYRNDSALLPHTGGRTTTATAGVSWIASNGHIGVAVSHLDNRYGLPTTVSIDNISPGSAVLGRTDDISIDMRNTRYDLNTQWHEVTPWLEKIDYSLGHIDYRHAELEHTVPGTRFTNVSWQHRLQLTMNAWHGWHTVVGLQHNEDEFAALGTESFIPVTDINSTGLFVVGDYHSGPLTFELGMRVNHDGYDPQQAATPARSFNTDSLSGSVLWDSTGPLTIGLSLSRSQRAPSVEELYSNHGLSSLATCVIHDASGSCEIGNDSFRAETSLNTDLTFSWNFERLKATVTLFNNQFNDYIAQLADGREVDGVPVRLYTQQDAQFRGVELDLNWKIGERYNLRLYADSVRGYLQTSGDMPRLPPGHAGIELGYKNANWSAHVSYQDGRAQQRPGSFELGSASWARLEAGIDYTFDLGKHGELLLFATGRNLLDDSIRLSTSYLRSFAPEAGRSLETGIRYRF